MLSHITALGFIQVVRSMAGLGLGSFLIWRSFKIPLERLHRLEPGDLLVFGILGAVWVALALFRGAQGLLTLRMVARSRAERAPPRSAGPFARRAGIALAVVDLIDLTAFPVTTACGTYGLLVYTHLDTREFFEAYSRDTSPRRPAGARC